MVNIQDYKSRLFNGFCFKESTPDIICNILINAYKQKTRLRLFYGDSLTGLDWGETSGTKGYVGFSNGKLKIPILISKSNSRGGPAILDSAIVKITQNKKIIYQHPNYSVGNIVIRNNVLYKDADIFLQNVSLKELQNMEDFLRGIRDIA